MRRRLLISSGITALMVVASLVAALAFSAMFTPPKETAHGGMIAQAEAQRKALGYAAVVTPVPVVRHPKVVALATPTIEVGPETPAQAEPAAEPAGDSHQLLADNERAPLETSPRYLADDRTGPVTAIDVAGNPRRFVGAQVHWTCVIRRVPEATFADASCGPPIPSFTQPPLSDDELNNDPQAVLASNRLASHRLHHAISALIREAPIVLTGPVGDLTTGDVIVIDGTVRHPLRGQNPFGVERSYPTVHIDHIRRGRLH